MRKSSQSILLVWLGLLFSGAVFAQETGLPPVEILPHSQLQPGMKGVGKTVFKGTRIEEFEVEVLGVLEKADLNGDLILIRITSGPVVERQAGVIAGMSGSPIYVDGKLIGAMAYAWGFAKEPIAGVTPATDMLKVLDAAAEELPSPVRDACRTPTLPHSHAPTLPRSHTCPLNPPLRLGGHTFDRVLLSRRPFDPGFRPGPRTLALAPVQTLVQVSGLSPRGLERLGEQLKPYNLEVMQGGGAGTKDEDVELVPGAAVAVELMRGDVRAAATGTLTYRNGNRFLAFGHPFMQRGRTSVPFASAYVVEIIPSLQRSVRMTAPMRPLGTVRQDDYWAIAGDLGAPPPMIPATVEILDRDRGKARTVRFEVIDDRDLAPGLILGASADAVFYTLGQRPDTMVSVVTEVKPKGRPALRREEFFYGKGFVDFQAVRNLSEMLGLVTTNIFEPSDVESVHFKVEVEQARRTARIERLYVKKDVVQPGETLEVFVELRPFGAEDLVTRTLRLPIPRNVPDGTCRLGVAGGSQDAALRKPLGLLQPTLHNLDQLIAFYLDYRRGDQLVARLALPTQGVEVEGQLLPALPASLVNVLTSTKRSAGVQRGRDEVYAVVDTEWEIQGQQLLNVVLSETGQAPAKRPAPPPAGESSLQESAGEWYRPEPLLDLGASHPPTRREGPGRDSNPSIPANDHLDGEADSQREPVAEAGGNGPGQKEEDKKAQARGIQGPAAQTWTETEAADFGKGEGEGIALTSDGELCLGAGQRRLWASDQPLLWAVAADEAGNLYLASGHEGRIFKRTPAGETTLFYQAADPEILSLAVAADGTVYAGSAPSGQIYKIAPDGTGTVLYDTPEHYVWDLALGEQGALYAGTGREAKLYRLALDTGAAEVVYDCPEAHVLSLARAEDGTLYLGTGDRGKLYRVRPDGQTEALFDAPEAALHALALGPDGTLYVGTSEKGILYRISAEGQAEVLYDAPPNHIFRLVAAPDDGLYAVTGEPARLYRVAPEDGAAQLLFEAEAAQILDAVLGPEGTLYAVTSDPAELYQFTLPHTTQGEFVSQAFDAQGPARWGHLTWQALVPEKTTLTISTRSGNTERPDASWSPWSLPSTLSEAPIQSPPARFLQYRIAMRTEDVQVTPRLQSVTIHYVRQNEKPTLTVEAPQSGDVWSGQKDIRWKAQDGNGDPLSLDLAVSSDGGQTWADLATDLRPDKPQYAWDTRKVKDGVYRLRVVASDRLQHPDDAREAEKVVDRVIIDNTPPRVALVGAVEVVDGSLTARAFAKDQQTRIARAEYRLDNGDWLPALAEDGLFDYRFENLRIRTRNVKPGDHTLAVRAADAAGNEAKAEKKFTVEAPAREEATEEESAPPPEAGPSEAETAADQPEVEAEQGQPKTETGEAPPSPSHYDGGP